jgi:hypothetical protein
MDGRTTGLQRIQSTVPTKLALAVQGFRVDLSGLGDLNYLRRTVNSRNPVSNTEGFNGLIG